MNFIDEDERNNFIVHEVIDLTRDIASRHLRLKNKKRESKTHGASAIYSTQIYLLQSHSEPILNLKSSFRCRYLRN